MHPHVKAANLDTRNYELLQWAPHLLPAWYVLAVAMSFFWLPPVGQDHAYHNFADQRALTGIGNFADVSSNAALLLGGILGVLASLRLHTFRSGLEGLLALTFFVAIVLTAIGSTWYHIEPDNLRLFWDRLPLSLAFTALPAWLIAERIAPTRSAVPMLGLWLLAGPLSVVYWHLGELAGQGDLRPYFLLHVFMMLLPPALMLLRSAYTHGFCFMLAYSFYLLAMAGDRLDHQVYELTGQVVSGHTLKHLLTGAAAALLAWMVAVRTRL